jgi:hypothetical protein
MTRERCELRVPGAEGRSLMGARGRQSPRDDAGDSRVRIDKGARWSR